MAEILWSLTAAKDLEEIENHIAEDSIAHAVHFVDRLIESTEKLADSPRIGRVVPEFQRQDLREILFRNYRVVCQLNEERAIILRVVHGARELNALMRDPPWTLG